jgi:CRISPR-associated protein Cas1
MTMRLENTLYVMTQGTYVRLDHETVLVESEHKALLKVPLHHVGELVVMGNVLVSPFLIHKFFRDGKCIHWLSEHGRYQGSTLGPTRGNVLLRRSQYRSAEDDDFAKRIARHIVTGKIRNQRNVLMRGARELGDKSRADILRDAGARLLTLIHVLDRSVVTMNRIRGIEGLAARVYFSALPLLIRRSPGDWSSKGRSRRPPLDPFNSILSFGYALLRGECLAACETVGLDPQVGFLHVMRPGRPALALDLMEEFRAPIVDRIACTLINRQQVSLKNFTVRPGGAVALDDRARRELIAAYQERKQDEVNHPVLNTRVPVGLLPFYQAKLLARHLRGDLENYPPCIFG